MTPWYNHLISSYPYLFSKISHIETDKGWESIILSTCKFLHSQNHKINSTNKFYFTQIKEKFGSIRFYIEDSYSSDSPYTNPYINGFLHAMEDISHYICESCGSPGSIQQFNNTLKCQCPPCAHNRNKLIIFK